MTAPSGSGSGSGTVTASLTYTAGGDPDQATGTATVSVPYPDLPSSFDNTGITDDTNTAAGDVDGSSSSYSAQALASIGITPGSTITHEGSTFTWPAAAPGQPDNTITAGQAITIGKPGSTLAFLVTSTAGASSGTGTILYTDGTRQTFTLSAPDWYGTPDPSSDPAITAPYRNRPGNTQDPNPVSIFYRATTLDPTKTVADVILPSTATVPVTATPTMHIFAMNIS